MIRWLSYWWETHTEEHGHLSYAALKFWLCRLAQERERG